MDAHEYLTIEDKGTILGKKTRRFIVRNKRSGSALGIIKWHGPWRQYVFHPATDTLFNAGCLAVIGKRCDAETTAHREKLRMEKAGGE